MIPALHTLLPLLFLAASPPAPAELYPKGEVYPIGGYASRPAEDQAAGFTLAGPSYRDSYGVLKQAEEVGMQMVYRIRSPFNVKRMERDLTPEELKEVKAEITEQVSAVAASQHIHSWSISPEELRHWRARELDYLKLAVETIRASDPQKRPVWMYEPGHRQADALAQLLPYMDVSAKGTYVNYSSRKDERGWVRLSVAEQADAIRRANPSALLYALPEMFQEPEADELKQIPQWVRHDVYSSLLSGAEGILVYSFANRRGFHARQLYYDAYAAVARELNSPIQPAMAVLKGRSQTAPALTHLEGPRKTTLSGKPPLKTSVELPSLLTKAFLWKNREYLFIINSANASVTIALPASDWSLLRDASPDTPLPDRFTLEPWEVVVAHRLNRSSAFQ